MHYETRVRECEFTPHIGATKEHTKALTHIIDTEAKGLEFVFA